MKTEDDEFGIKYTHYATMYKTELESLLATRIQINEKILEIHARRIQKQIEKRKSVTIKISEKAKNIRKEITKVEDYLGGGE